MTRHFFQAVTSTVTHYPAMNIFVDTEFSSLGSDPRLLSIALVTENGAELYIEFSSGWTFEQCSPWVKNHVLPLLGQGLTLSRAAAVAHIDAWLTSLAAPVTLHVDSDWDAELIGQLLAENGLDRTRYPLQVLQVADRAAAEALAQQRAAYFAQHQCTPHHALHDARALRASWDSLKSFHLDVQ